MKAAQEPETGDAKVWWSHSSIDAEAEPLDATADDAATSCLALITDRTAQLVRAHKEVLLSASTPPWGIVDADGSGEKEEEAESAVKCRTSAGGLQRSIKWGVVLSPLLLQLRKSMARAWEEREAEQAEAAAGGVESSAKVAGAISGIKPTAVVDVALARRLRALQQQIYMAFLRAVARGLADGARDATEALSQEDTCAPSAALELKSSALAVLLDGLLVDILLCADASGVATSSPTEEVAMKSRRVVHRHFSADTPVAAAGAGGNHFGDWFVGMLPLYVRAVQQQQRDGAAKEERASTAVPVTATARLPSPALCLVSYVGSFVQGAGLQLLPTEQAAYLPCFSKVIRDIFHAQLLHAVQSTVAQSSNAALEMPTPDLLAAAVAHLRYAEQFLRAVTEAQLFGDDSGADVGDEDYTIAYAAVPPIDLLSVKSRLGEEAYRSTGSSDYSVAPLLTLTSYANCDPFVRQMAKWWTACQDLIQRARAATPTCSEADKERNEEGARRPPQQEGLSSSDVSPLKLIEEAWVGLRKQAMLFTLHLSNYEDTTLLLVPYIALLIQVFYTSDASAQSAWDGAVPPLDVWKRCLRDVHNVTHANHNGYTFFLPFSHATTGATRRPRMHHRHTRDCSFAAACASLTPDSLSHALHNTGSVGAPGAVSTGSPTKGDSRSASSPLLPFAFSLIQQPLAVMCDHVLPAVASANGISTTLCIDAIVREQGKAAGISTQAADGTASRPATPARATALASLALSSTQIVELSFPRHLRIFYAVDEAVHSMQDRLVALMRQASAALRSLCGEGEEPMWASDEALPAIMASYVGAALDEAGVVRMQAIDDEVVHAELLMFYIAVLRTLPVSALPQLRRALTTFLGEGGRSVVEYLRHHIVDQQRYGLAVVWVPPLRALALDYTSADGNEASLALAAKAPYRHAIAYLWELPRLYFWCAEDTPVAEVAWHAPASAERYLCELMASSSVDFPSSPFSCIMRKAGEVAMQRSPRAQGSGSSAHGMTGTRSLAIDIMSAVFFGVCRWCVALQATASSAATEAARLLLHELAGSYPSSPSPGCSPSLHPLLLAMKDGGKGPGQGGKDSSSCCREAAMVQDDHSGESPRSADCASPTSSQPLREYHRSLTWFWACTFDEVDTVGLTQTAAKRLLREFSTQHGSSAPTKTLLSIRAMVEQKMKRVEGADQEGAVAAPRALCDALHADLESLLNEQQHQAEVECDAGKAEAEEASRSVTETTDSVVAAVPPSTPTEPPLESVCATARLAAATLRSYLNELQEALVARARISPVDGAISAAVLEHLLRALSDPQLPIVMSAQERQRMCQRFVFSVMNSLAGCTRVEALSCLCSVRLVLVNIALPYKKSFLNDVAATRLFHRVLSDVEGDAVRMVQHLFGDVIAAVQKLAERSGVLEEVKVVLVLRQLGEPLSLVRNTYEKLSSTVKSILSRQKGVVVDEMRQQLSVLEKMAAREDRGVADDVFHLFTLHPQPALAPSLVVEEKNSKTVTASSPSSSPLVRQAWEREKVGSDLRATRDRRRPRDEKPRRSSSSSGHYRRGGGDGGGGWRSKRSRH